MIILYYHILIFEFGLRPIYAYSSSFSPLPGMIVVCLFVVCERRQNYNYNVVNGDEIIIIILAPLTIIMVNQIAIIIVNRIAIIIIIRRKIERKN